MLGLVYISGYVAHVALKHNSCNSCHSLLTLKDAVSNVMPQQDNYYFNVINRGSLKYPSDTLLEVIVVGFKVFKTLISERYEGDFLSVCNQRKALKTTITEFLNVTFENCDSCGYSFMKLIDKCLISFCNILINNYSKSIMDTVVKKKRKSNAKEKSTIIRKAKN